MDDPRTLVSTDWLAARLADPAVKVLDASWYLPDEGKDARAQFETAHIPGARFVDLGSVSDPHAELPHMAPAPDAFAERMRALGVNAGDGVVVYDGAGLFSAARVWWLLRHMGRPEVAVLDGGLPKWRAKGRPVEAGWPDPPAGNMTAEREPRLVADADGVRRAAGTGAREVVDARSATRFAGATPEPRPGLTAGHIPGSHNLPFTDLLAADGTMKSPEALRGLFDAAGVDLSKPVVTTCGSGVTAAILNLALARMGRTEDALYDGSWSEWGRLAPSEIAQG